MLAILSNTWYCLVMLQRVSIWLDKKSIASLKEIGQGMDRPVGWIIRKAVEDFIERQKTNKQSSKGEK